MISAEKMALIAEKGIDNVSLNEEERAYLSSEGLDELYALKTFMHSPIPSLDAQSVDSILDSCFSSEQKESIHNLAQPHSSPIQIFITIKKKTIDVVSSLIEHTWEVGTPAFSFRDATTSQKDRISFQKKVEDKVIHVEFSGNETSEGTLKVLLSSDCSNPVENLFEIELYKGDRCIESDSTPIGELLTFTQIQLGDYLLVVSDEENTITTLAFKLQ